MNRPITSCQTTSNGRRKRPHADGAEVPEGASWCGNRGRRRRRRIEKGAEGAERPRLSLWKVRGLFYTLALRGEYGRAYKESPLMGPSGAGAVFISCEGKH